MGLSCANVFRTLLASVPKVASISGAPSGADWVPSRRNLLRRLLFVVTALGAEEGLGRVVLKSSSASSSIDNLIVSWMARSSSALLFRRSSHSDGWLPKFSASLSAKVSWAANDLFVSARWPFKLFTSIPRSLGPATKLVD